MTQYDDEAFIKKDLSKSTAINDTSSVPVPIAPRKKLLWQLEYKSVPYYIRIYNNRLFVCDKYGYLALYIFNRLNNYRQKPIFLNDLTLFNDNSRLAIVDDDQATVDSFVVSKLWIIVLRRKKIELHGTIYLFTHEGKLLPNGTYLHNYPSRELTLDMNTNLLWSLDQTQLSLFYYQLPDQVEHSDKLHDCFQNRYLHLQYPKSLQPEHISVNKTSLAVLDKRRQVVHVYDKKTNQKLYEHVNNYNMLTYFCWDMALFSNNNLLIKLDQTDSLKSGPSKHIYLQLDATNPHHAIGMIEEIDAYGMIITPTDDIFIGVRLNKKGIVKCYA